MAEENQAVKAETVEAATATPTVTAASAKTVSLWDCPKCRMHNPIGSKFCRECGAKLAPPDNELQQEDADRADRERRQERVAGLITSAFRKSEAGHPYEALPLAEEAVSLLPESTAALALLASLYERTNQPEKALEAMERVVILNPDSMTDRRRLERMRRGEFRVSAATPVVSSADNRKPAEAMPWVPLVFAGAAMALVFGVLVSTLGNRPATGGPQPVSPTTTFRPAYSPLNNGVSNRPTNLYIGTQQAYNPPAPVVTPYVRATPNPANAGSANRGPARPGSGPRAGGLPLPGQVAPNPGGPVPQADPASDPGTGTLPAPGSVPPVVMTPPPQRGNGFGNGDRMRVGPPRPGTSEPGGPVTEAQTPNGGYIRIRVGPGGTQTQTPVAPPPTPEGDNPPTNPNPQPDGNGGANRTPGESPNARAYRLQTEGRYAEAVAAYREAVARDLATGDTYLGIARCLEKVGESMGAKTAYGQAIRAYEAQISAGRSTPAVRQGIVTCRAALDVLGG